MLITLRSKGVKSESRRNLLKPNPNLSQRPIMIMKQNHGLPIIHLALIFFCAKSFYWLMVNRIPVIIRESLHQIISVLTVWYLFRFICLVCYRRRSVTLDTCTKHLIRRNPCLMLKGLRLYEETQFPQWQRFAISLNDLFIHNLLLNRYHLSYFGVLLWPLDSRKVAANFVWNAWPVLDQEVCPAAVHKVDGGTC